MFEKRKGVVLAEIERDFRAYMTAEQFEITERVVGLNKPKIVAASFADLKVELTVPPVAESLPAIYAQFKLKAYGRTHLVNVEPQAGAWPPAFAGSEKDAAAVQQHADAIDAAARSSDPVRYTLQVTEEPMSGAAVPAVAHAGIRDVVDALLNE
ncbi:MAG: hypothetical protein ACREJT_04110 [Myxococcota bacterium]